MGRKKTEIKFSVELSYILEPFGTSESNACGDTDAEFKRYQKAHQDNTTTKHLTPYARSNFSVVIPTGKKEFGEIQEEVDGLQIERFIELCNEYITFLDENSKPVFPDVKSNTPTSIDVDFKKKFQVDKNKLIYRTNLFSYLNCNDDPESKLLDILQQMIDEGYEKYINLNMHFNCWAYYIGEKSSYDFTVQELIDHRRNNI
jgi:hypothetical protein